MLVDEDGRIMKSSFEEDSLEVPENSNFKVEVREYTGCPAWHDKEFDF